MKILKIGLLSVALLAVTGVNAQEQKGQKEQSKPEKAPAPATLNSGDLQKRSDAKTKYAENAKLQERKKLDPVKEPATK